MSANVAKFPQSRKAGKSVPVCEQPTEQEVDHFLAEREQHAMQTQAERFARSKPLPKPILAAQDDGPPQFSIDHEDQIVGKSLLAEALGTSSWDFAFDVIRQLSMIYVDNGDPGTFKRLNSSLTTAASFKPQDETEALMAVQMTAIHRAMVQWAARAEKAMTLETIEAANVAMNKLARTFAVQMDTLKRYRTGGQQKVTVEHVHVHAGGQAIVGSVGVGKDSGAA